MVLILKGDRRDFRGVGLVEVLWKTNIGIINRRLTSAIRYHDTLHGFWAGRGTGTATLEAKLLRQLTAMREVVLHEILLDLQKAYDVLDRDRCLGILAGYSVGPRTLRLLRTSGAGFRW